jgi:hypothetical protein
MTAASIPIDLPARVTVRCPACGAARTALALHDNALARARRCTECAATGEVVAVEPLHGLGCSCCS